MDTVAVLLALWSVPHVVCIKQCGLEVSFMSGKLGTVHVHVQSPCKY